MSNTLATRECWDCGEYFGRGQDTCPKCGSEDIYIAQCLAPCKHGGECTEEYGHLDSGLPHSASGHCIWR